jgi:Leucine-rich repeat (LRR) protein
VLDISGNRLASLSILTGLHSLETLLADSNDLSDPEDIITFLASNRDLKTASLINNPVIGTSSTLRDAIVLLCPQLEFFNGNSVSASEREFVKRKALHNATLKSMIGNTTF